jgi:alpha-beta hydrolase superfamily lysophospholipase
MQAHHAGRLTGRATASLPRLAPGRHDLGSAIVVVPPEPLAILVFFHGAGGTASQSEQLVAASTAAAGLVLVCPSSVGPTWDLLVARSFGRDLEAVAALIAEVGARTGTSASPLALGGFSDGASYALSVGLGNGDRVDAVLALSPGFAAPSGLVGAPRVFLSHGVHDRVLPVACSRRIHAALDPTHEVHAVEFDGGHEVPRWIVEESLRWFVDVG